MNFIMSKKFLPVLLVLICGGLFVTYGVMGRGDRLSDNPKTKYEKILKNVGIVLEEGHYSPKTIDDAFSKEVLNKYEDGLDPDKFIFYQKDIDDFKKYENKIDDEIHGAPLESFYAISKTYLARLNEVSKNYKEILSKPFDFSKDESLQLDGEKRTFPKTEAERYDYSRKRLKYLVLGRFVDLQDERAKLNKDSLHKADSTLEREAREIVSRQMDRYFLTLKNHNTPDDMFSDFVNAITGSMDPHTTYFEPVDKRSFDELLSGTFFGIGAQLKEDDGKIKIGSLITGGPAWKSGDIQPEDEIIKVAQGNATPVDVTGYAVTDAVKLIRGEQKGSEVRLTLKKADGSIKVVPILRDKISLDDTFAKSAIVNDGTNKIGYIYLPEFYADFDDPSARRSATDVAKEVQKLKDAKVDGIVIDLRGNGGGSLNDVVDMVGLFIKDGPVVQVKGRDEKASVLNDRDKDVLYSGPLAVMVDEMSASASEIFAAAIQDYHRGVIIGSTSTYGKGTVQRSISLDPQSENPLFSKPSEGLGDLKLTFRKFYRINGGATQLRGVVPDIIIPDRLENVKFREKDNPDALSWDEIPKATYTTWNPGYSYNSIVSEANTDLQKSPVFKGIREDVDQLDKYNDAETPLNIQKYRAQIEQIKTLSKKLDSLTKLSSEFPVHNIASDSLTLGNDSDKIAKNKQFLKHIGDDIYINQTVKVVEKMIGEEQLAQTK
ncbi:tail-specific protease [Ginsengibacter hankyongi]|uniref:Tail-specific protease n=2 Tax=Ginsengibacter hankyongi TaxID=2607284 RepID=A0A5J5ICH6_9BACT|nr:tail-specific protease [Ginsengibacter hankyongi]